MRMHSSLKDWARSFAENFDEADRPAVEDWYHDKLRREARARFWLWVRAVLIVLLFIVALPAMVFFVFW